MELIVYLRPHEHPKVIDSKSGKDVTEQVYKVEILPHRVGKAYLYRLNADGKKYKTACGRIARLGAFPVVKIYGKWISDEVAQA